MYLSNFLGTELECDFDSFNLSEAQEVLDALSDADIPDLVHAEILQQKALRGADLLSGFIGRLVKTTSFLESRLSSIKNSAALNYQAPDGAKTTADMRKWYSEIAPEVEEVQIKLAKAKGAKSFLEKKYDILIRSHHHYKDIATGLRKTIVGQHRADVPEGY